MNLIPYEKDIVNKLTGRKLATIPFILYEINGQYQNFATYNIYAQLMTAALSSKMLFFHFVFLKSDS